MNSDPSPIDPPRPALAGLKKTERFDDHGRSYSIVYELDEPDALPQVDAPSNDSPIEPKTILGFPDERQPGSERQAA